MKLSTRVGQVIRDSYCVRVDGSDAVTVTQFYNPLDKIKEFATIDYLDANKVILRPLVTQRPYTNVEMLTVFQSGQVRIRHRRTGTVSKVIGLSFDGTRVICAGQKCNWPMTAAKLFEDYLFDDVSVRCGVVA